ncbi:MAG: type II toxin-antitoxin system VapC family toxin [Betaproteobacteria bacterium]|nr:type II toxin-antitoxin system VapC family toxin [Betaproteobacteria bacterium]
MGLILDTDVLIRGEKSGSDIDFNRWAEHGDAYICAITCSELLVGVHRANTPTRRARRLAYVEALLARLPVLVFDATVARTHAQLHSNLPRHVTLGAHDLIIGATALAHGFSLLTANVADFNRMPGVNVVPFA